MYNIDHNMDSASDVQKEVEALLEAKLKEKIIYDELESVHEVTDVNRYLEQEIDLYSDSGLGSMDSVTRPSDTTVTFATEKTTAKATRPTSHPVSVVSPIKIEQSTPVYSANDMLARFLAKYPHITLFDRIAGLIYGCALGDCVGIPVEGRSLEDIKRCIPDGVKGMPTENMRGINRGDWSDDTDQLILLMDVLAENKLVFNPNAYAKKLLFWKNKGFPELGDLAGMGIGAMTARVLSKQDFVQKPVLAAVETYKEMGGDNAPNGAIMRCGISAISKNWQRTAIHQSIITHVDSRCIYSSWLLTAMCRVLLNGSVPTIDKLLKNKVAFIKRKAHVVDFNKHQKIYEGDLGKLLENLELGTDGSYGYTLKALGCAFYALRCIEAGKIRDAEDFKRIALLIVNQGGDTDTNTAVACQALGSHLGYSKLPKDWLAELRHKDWLDKKIISLFKTIIEM